MQCCVIIIKKRIRLLKVQHVSWLANFTVGEIDLLELSLFIRLVPGLLYLFHKTCKKKVIYLIIKHEFVS